MERYTETVICATCKRATMPFVISREEPHENAVPRIPARIVLQCAQDNCKSPWYIVDEDREREIADAR